MRGTVIERFIAKVAVDPETGCWNWTGHRYRGYGRFTVSVERTGQKAHRVAHEVFIGPIPEGLEPDHTCRNTGCVNPFHLELVSHAENCLRGESPPAHNARKKRCDSGHLFDEANTHVKHDGSRSCRTCNRLRVRAYRERLKAAA